MFTPALTGDPTGPFVVGATSGPPFGTGSLNFAVAATEKATFGNEVEFFNTPFAVTAVGFHVLNVGENTPAGNMPGIAFEIDPNIGAFATNYSTLVYTPTSTPPGWSDYIDGTTEGLWGLTGTAFNGQNCSLNGPRCTWAEMMTFLGDGGAGPTLYTVAITKGVDNAWHGAIDGLRINDTVYNFEEHGVVAEPAV